MAQTNPSDGWEDMPQQGGWEDMPEAQPKPSVLHRALSWFTEPFDAHKPTIEKNRQLAARSGPLGSQIGKDSGDVMAGIGAFASGLPGSQEASAPPEAQARVEKFRQDHRVLGTLLPLAAGFAQPVPGLPKGAPSTPPKAAPSVLPGALEAATAGNPYEAAARAAKVQGLAKAVEQNVTAHLGADMLNRPDFAEKLAAMPEQWWEGMAKVAKTNKPSPTTIAEVGNFFKTRAGQIAEALPQEAAPIASAAQPGRFATALNSMGEKLSGMPQKPLDMMDLFTLTHGGIEKEIALRALRNYGPRVAGSALKTVAKAPGPVLIQSVNAAKALEGQ